MIKSLYISYDGMTDPLGQSQVLPYLKALSAKDIRFTLMSFEKGENFKKHKKLIQRLCDESHIVWKPFLYTKRPPVLSTVYDILKLQRHATTLVEGGPFDIVHCRSYLSALVGLRLKKKYGLKFIFDMRGFWADERVDGNLWNLKNPIYKWVYNFFKKKEIEFLTNADCTISLTENGKKEMQSWKNAEQFSPIEVIPCCADLEHFSIQNIDIKLQDELKATFKINDDDFILSYLGSIGTWYMLEEMLQYFKELKKKYKTAKFLFITKDSPDHILGKAHSLDIDTDSILIRSASRQEVPTLLSLSDLNIFFIKPAYSKISSSPTKQGEVMSMGIPIICNDFVGDTGKIIRDHRSGYVIQDFSESTFLKCIANLEEIISIPKDQIKKGALTNFSLKVGIDKYQEVYTSILN